MTSTCPDCGQLIYGPVEAILHYENGRNGHGHMPSPCEKRQAAHRSVPQERRTA